MEILLLLLVTVLALSTAATIPSNGLHVVFAIDGTTGVEREGFDTEKSLVMDLSDALPAHSTVGIIAVGAQPQNVLPFSELPLSVDRILSIAFPRSNQFNLSGALLLAQEQLSSLRGHGVIVVITARDLLCDESPSTEPAICRTVARIRSSGTIVITVGIRFREMMTWPRQFLDDDRFSLRANRTLLPDFTAILMSLKMFSPDFSRSERPSSTSTHAAPVNLATVDAACGSTYSELWLDLIIMVDSSAGPAEDGFITFVSLLLDLIEDLKIGQNGKKTRLSLVNMGTTAHVVSDLNTFSSTQEALDAIQGLRYLNDAELNLQEGLRAALNISRVQGRRNARQLFVLFSTKPADCPDEQAPNSPCRIAFDVRQQGVLMTVAVGYKDTGIPSISSLATPCYSLTNTGDFETRFASLATKANCFCENGLWTQSAQGCDLYNTLFLRNPGSAVVGAR